jgi:D-alanyl-D-alanine carboxypeptidase
MPIRYAARLFPIIGALIALSTCRAGAAPAADAALAHRIDSYVSAQASAGHFSGVVLLVRHGTVVYEGATGLASISYDVPNTADTAFNVGSIGKIMTRVVIDQLVDTHRLAYDQTIGDLLPDYTNKAAGKITVRELLDMTSGIGDFFGDTFDSMPKDKFRTLRDYLPLFEDKPLLFAPGTGRAYSNGGYIVLGLIIEHVTKQSYYDYVRDHVFKPAGMTHASFPERDAPTRGLATGYANVDENDPSSARRDNVYMSPVRGSSAGGFYASARDLVAFAQALESGKLLPADDSDGVLRGGLGVAGGAPGVNADLDMDPQSGYVLVVVSNYDPPSAVEVAKTIRGYLGLS